MINTIAILILIVLVLFKYIDLVQEAENWEELALKQKKLLKEDVVKFKRLKVEYSKVYDFAEEYPQNFKQEQIQAINKEIEQLNGRVVTLEESERKKMLNYTKKYLEELCEQ